MTLSPDSAVVLRDPSLDQLPAVVLGAVGADEPDLPTVEESNHITLTPDQLDDLRATSFADGERIGRQAIEEEHQAEIEALAEILRAAADAAHESQASSHALFAAETTDIALRIAELILQRELNAAEDPGRDAIVRCLSEVRADEVATFHLNPSDAARLSDIEALLSGRTFTIVADDDVIPGDCLVRLPGGSIDGSIGGALARVEELLR